MLYLEALHWNVGQHTSKLTLFILFFFVHFTLANYFSLNY